MTRRALALVETATQLINAVEWVYATGEQATTRITVLEPVDAESIRQIESVAVAARADGITVTVRPVRRPGLGMGLMAAQVMADVARASTLIIGDTFSRYIHGLLPLYRAEHVVIVDDGTSTWNYASLVDAGDPLVRWTRQPGQVEAHAVRATRLLTPSPRRSIDVFTCLTNASPAGATALANRYSWIRSTPKPEVIDDQLDLLGTSLVASGVVKRRAYINAIARLARDDRPVRYIAHRRESDELVAEITALPNLRVVRPGRPVEMLLRSGPVARHVVSFPSTAAHTLPVVLQDADVILGIQPIEADWFTRQATPRARAFVTRIADEAPMTRDDRVY